MICSHRDVRVCSRAVDEAGGRDGWSSQISWTVCEGVDVCIVIHRPAKYDLLGHVILSGTATMTKILLIPHVFVKSFDGDSGVATFHTSSMWRRSRVVSCSLLGCHVIVLERNRVH